MAGVDVGELHFDEGLNHGGRFGDPAFEQHHCRIDDLIAQLVEARELLTLALVHNAGELFVDQLAASQTGILQSLDLLLDQNLKRHLGHKQRRPRPRGVPDRSADIVDLKPLQRIHHVQSAAKSLVEDVADARAPRQLCGGELLCGPVHDLAELGREFRQHLQQQSPLVDLIQQRVSQRGERVRGLRDQRVDPRLQIRQAVADVVHQMLAQRFAEMRSSAAVGERSVGGVAAEEGRLLLEGTRDVFVFVDVLLAAIHNPVDAQLHRIHAPRQNIDRIRARVHQINLGDHRNRADAHGVVFERDFEGIRVGEVNVGGGDGEDEAVGVLDVGFDQVVDLGLNVDGLIADRDFGDAGKIDQREVEDFAGVDFELDGVFRDSFVGPGKLHRSLLDFATNLAEIKKFQPRFVQKLSVLFENSSPGIRRRRRRRAGRLGRDVDEL
eukprot:Sdes_comp21093_c0_seq1m19776